MPGKEREIEGNIGGILLLFVFAINNKKSR